jgi:hypothetical protein
MANKYRKLFNLFAFSVLALAIYLNFFSSDDDTPSQKNKNISYQQNLTVPKAKSLVASEAIKTSLAKEDKKN